MPDARLARARRSLPARYQFGDALWQYPASVQAGHTITVPLPPRWRPLHENAAAQLIPRHFHVWRHDVARNGLVCDCGVLRTVDKIWNVIEGEDHG